MIDWEKVWKEFDEWWYERFADQSIPSTEQEQTKIQELVDEQLLQKGIYQE